MWRWPMRSAGNFHPEWGYFAPMPSFRRTLRIAVVAAAIGATAGLLAGVSLLRPSRSHVYNVSIPARALINSNSTVAMPLPAETLANTAATSANTAPAALALLSPDGAGSVKITPANDVSGVPPTAAAKSEPGIAAARKGPGRAHRLRVANGRKHPHYEREFAPSFELPHSSTFVQLNQSCCAWTTPPTQRNTPQW